MNAAIWPIAALTATASSTPARHASATAGWRSSTSPAASSRWPTKTTRAGSCSTARSTTTATLRPELEAAGHRFRTSSDTETILHAYEQYGPACVDRLEGMFAFAIYDERRRELFVARDRLGKKPLFYAVLDGVLHFASELPALAASPLVEGRPRPDRPRRLPVARVLPRAEHTIYRRLQADAGHWLHVKDGRVDDAGATGTSREFDTDRRATENALLDAVDDDARHGGARIGSKARCRSARS